MHHQLHPFTRPPPAGSSRGRTGVRGVPRSVTLRCSNRLVVLTITERQARYRERRKAGESGTAGPADRRIASDHGGTEGRTPPRVVSVMRPRVQWPDESARRFTLARSTPRAAACSGPEGRRWCGSGASSTAAPRPWWTASAFPKSPRTRHHALHAEPSPPACRRRLTPTPTGSRPARHPESGGLPRPVGRRGRPGRPVQAGPQGP